MGIKHAVTKTPGQRVFAVADWNADHIVDSNIDIGAFNFTTTGIGTFRDGLKSNTLETGAGASSISVQGRLLQDNLVNNALNWENRTLISSDGIDVILDWNTIGLADFKDSTITTTGLLNSSNHTINISSGDPTLFFYIGNVEKARIYIDDDANDRMIFDVGGNPILQLHPTGRTMSINTSMTRGNLFVRASGGQDALQSIMSDGGSTSAMLILEEGLNYGMYLEYDGGANFGYIGMSNNVAPDGAWTKIIKMARADTYIEFIAGDVIVSAGDLYFSGAGTGLCYGSCSCYGIGWTQVAAQNTWYNVVDAAFIDGLLNNVTHDGNGKLTVLKAGVYKLNVALDWEVNAANKHIEVGFEVSGSGSAATEGIVCSEGKFANEEEGMSTTALLDLAANATIELCVRTIDVGNPTIKVDCVSLNCVQIGGT